MNHKRVYRIMQANNLLLARKYTERPAHTHDGKVIVMRSNLRWCSDGFEFTCWNGDVIRGAFIIDAYDREIIAWRAVVNVGISGSDVRDMMLEAVEKRFGAHRASHQVEMLSDNGSAYTARDTCIFASQLGLRSCLTPVKSPESNGTSETFVNTLKRDYVRVMPLPDAQAVLDQRYSRPPLRGCVGEKAAPSGPNSSPFNRAGVSARVRAARLHGLSCRMAWTRPHVAQSMIASCSPGYARK